MNCFTPSKKGKTISLLENYQQHLEQNRLRPDGYQQQAIERLQAIAEQLQLNSNWPRRLFKPQPPKSLYIIGPVGRGKTMLMDMFCASLPDGWVTRLHFNRFMAMVHQRMFRLIGTPDPLKQVARELTSECRVLCFDEFQLEDIGDAMILGRLLDELFSLGLVIVTTSNTPIRELYADGLHRDRILPALELMAARMDSLSLTGPNDYRELGTGTVQRYFLPGESDPETLFLQLTQQEAKPSEITICHRRLKAKAEHNDVLWLDFNTLCVGSRSSLDYIEIAERYRTIILSGVPQMSGQSFERIKARGTEDGTGAAQSTGERAVRIGKMDDPARRFITLIDELYDRRKELFIFADFPINDLYDGERLQSSFRRTISRLTEMQTSTYNPANQR